MNQTNSGKSAGFVFPPTLIFCNPICSNDCGVFFFVKLYFSFREIIFFVQPLKMQIFTVNITRVVWPHVTNVLDLRYFCEHKPLFHHLNLIPCRYCSCQRNIYFLVNICVRHTFAFLCSVFIYLPCYRCTLLLLTSVLHVFHTSLARQLSLENLPVHSLDARKPQ